MTYGEIQAGADEYGKTLAAFVNAHRLPAEWFELPDHIAIKCQDRADFDEQIATIKAHKTGDITAVDLEGQNRTLASVFLTKAITVGGFGSVDLLEIMQPRPEKEGQDLVGFEHMEFTFPDFSAITAKLDDEGVHYTLPDDNPHHKWVNIVLNDRGNELKLNNRSLSEIVAEETEKGENYVL